ncbi:23S rRNA pseudouridine(955/2504/2580) synthase RluC [Aliidiomarina quisquiliarum]|uniref:23S rRNA pseudouridine(955/2504/2580) synthase RluC n=1 Tax=Aliidiomarina quisquiliarum TaxID=2938947 RepID=UPI00208EEE15|nr:23S rRNA pseudouridine(955/2504/2580) synthase RluC [Aliidiomarina quisquiliarum]MCO4320849.1 23S rRNA pseudouridine(955/2504/2580) synthase RluC [Aliidiomarina quisquiliarum]
MTNYKKNPLNSTATPVSKPSLVSGSAEVGEQSEAALQVSWHRVSIDEAGQRLDNFLLARLKGVPKSMVYRIVRKGEVRVNKGRVKPEYKLQANDDVRIPPVRLAPAQELPNPKLDQIASLEDAILFEDECLIVINKPSGLAVHGGSGLHFGLIEGLRSLRPKHEFLELVHRLDRDTSGIILIAKKRSALRSLHQQLRENKMDKRYVALVAGNWPTNKKKVDAPLQRNTLKSGERVVRVDTAGKASLTRFKVLERFAEGTLIEAEPVTGRTHQIRVHTQIAGHPIAGDDKYGEAAFDAFTKQKGLERLFLHACGLTFIHPRSETTMRMEAPLDTHLLAVLNKLRS